MASTTYRHLGDVTGMYAAQEQFREVTKMVTKRHRFAVLGTMVRNAGQLPQPFWLGAACGGGSCSAATVPARTRPTADDRRHQKRTAWEGRP